jgi:hypothetical protein
MIGDGAGYSALRDYPDRQDTDRCDRFGLRCCGCVVCVGRVTKMLKGAVFFGFEYTYHPNGRCKTVKTTNAKGVVKVREYDRRDTSG